MKEQAYLEFASYTDIGDWSEMNLLKWEMDKYGHDDNTLFAFEDCEYPFIRAALVLENSYRNEPKSV